MDGKLTILFFTVYLCKPNRFIIEKPISLVLECPFRGSVLYNEKIGGFGKMANDTGIGLETQRSRFIYFLNM